MSMLATTHVGVAESLMSRGSLHRHLSWRPEMTPVAAYYMLIAMEPEHARPARYAVEAPRRSAVARIADALTTLLTRGRTAAAQPA
jgi:hypothetical protein